MVWILLPRPQLGADLIIGLFEELPFDIFNYVFLVKIPLVSVFPTSLKVKDNQRAVLDCHQHKVAAATYRRAITMSGNQDQSQNIRPPQFVAAGLPGLSASAAAAVQSRGTPSTLNLDDIFGDCFFTPEGEAVFLSENPQMQQVQQAQQQQLNQQQIAQGSILGSGEATPAQIASRPTQTGYVNVPQAGGIATTGLHKPKAAATVMGNNTAGAAPTQVPFAQAPQRPHHLQYAYVQAGGAPAAPPAAAAKRGKSTAVAKATDAQSKADRSKLVK